MPARLAAGRLGGEMSDVVDTGPVLVRVLPEEMGRWIERVLPHLAKMAEGSGGRFMAADIATAILRGEMHLWIILDGVSMACVFVTEFREYPRARSISFIGCVGRHPWNWAHLRYPVEEWARANGCSKAEAMVPHIKWKLIFDDYAVDHIRLEKVL